jgi:hypothetical protein
MASDPLPKIVPAKTDRQLAVWAKPSASLRRHIQGQRPSSVRRVGDEYELSLTGSLL